MCDMEALEAELKAEKAKTQEARDDYRSTLSEAVVSTHGKLIRGARISKAVKKPAPEDEAA